MKEQIKLLLLKAIAKKATNPSRLSLDAGLEVSAVGKILNGYVKGAPKIETLYKLSKALDIYPSELLPAEWQKPDGVVSKLEEHEPDLNLNILEKSIREVLESNTAKKLSSKKKAQLIVAAYLAHINK